jgi:hypothetical protein
MHLIMFSDFITILNSTRTHYTKVEYFPNHKLFYTLSLLQEQILNPRNYYKRELIMGIFIWATDPDMNMHEKIQSISKYVYL